MNANITSPVYVVWNGEMPIHAPVSVVWRHILDYPSWQNYPIVRHISGEAGQEGEVVLLKKDEASVEFPPYLARTIKLEPEKRVIWKVYPERGNDFFGIVDFKVNDAGGGTLFKYDLFYEFLVAQTEKSELEKHRRQMEVAVKAICASIYPKLKSLSETGRI